MASTCDTITRATITRVSWAGHMQEFRAAQMFFQPKVEIWNLPPTTRNIATSVGLRTKAKRGHRKTLSAKIASSASDRGSFRYAVPTASTTRYRLVIATFLSKQLIDRKVAVTRWYLGVLAVGTVPIQLMPLNSEHISPNSMWFVPLKPTSWRIVMLQAGYWNIWIQWPSAIHVDQ